jgi:hypothetical protein
MARMQVTFSDVSSAQLLPGQPDQHSTVSFEIQYRGKSYACVGHLRQAIRSMSTAPPRATFSGFYGYNGPINIQELRNAALDYFESVGAGSDDKKAASEPLKPGAQPLAARMPVSKSYAISVGRQVNQSWRLAG